MGIKFLKRILITGLIFSAVLQLSACSEIKYPEDVSFSEVTVSITPEALEIPEQLYNESKRLDYAISRQEFVEKIQIEGIAERTVYKALMGYDGNGYIQLDKDSSVTVTVDVPVAQHYRIGVCVCSTESIMLLSVGDISQGAYYIKNASNFTNFYMESIYLRAGVNELTFTVLDGISYFDYITVTDGRILGDERYSTSPLLANPNADENTQRIMKYLKDTFGNKVLTGQTCTINSNAELNAIYTVTGRHPAIRTGDLGNYSRNYPYTDKAENKELQLAEEWAKKGGLVSFSWSWYPFEENKLSSPLASETSFKLNDCFTLSDIAEAEINKLEAYRDSGMISQSCLELVLDIDDMAENLKVLRDKGITVLWRPLMEAGVGWYWWGNGTPDSYIWLWQLMFNRMSRYHNLTNLIWVWNGEETDYYPGDEYVDIIGEDVYNMGDTSNITRFMGTTRYGIYRKMAAMTECGLIPNPDVLFRDNAGWLWFSLYRGDYLINDDGLYKGGINTKERLIHAYNHEMTITLDELPNFYS